MRKRIERWRKEKREIGKMEEKKKLYMRRGRYKKRSKP